MARPVCLRRIARTRTRATSNGPNSKFPIPKAQKMRPASIVLAGLLLMAPMRPSVRVVKAGDDLQAALNAATAGDEIRLASGATFTGNFVLPAFDGTAPVTLRTDLPDASTPAPDRRVTPATAARYARIVSPNGKPALRTA